ncbi:response regulator transcription factor [candidate division KSB1 bacterium]|nr:response regulator transcription factor [candidate division KSB1 bacterium]
MKKKTIIIADDHPIVRAGLIKVLHSISNLEVVAECKDGIDALNSIRTLNPDIAILDLAMPGINGFEVIRNVRDLGLKTDFIVLTMYTDEEYYQTAVDEGVKGYLLKDNTNQELKNCIEHVLDGKEYFKPLIKPSKKVI